MEAYAVVETGGKQYRVTVGEKLEIERLDAEVGKDVEIPTVLALSDGNELKIDDLLLFHSSSPTAKIPNAAAS